MFRKSYIDLLLDQQLTVAQIAQMVSEPPSQVVDDLRHLFQSLRHTEYQPDICPAECRKCGFVFGPDKLTKPSKCPQCHSTWLLGPQIGVRRVVSGAAH